MNGLPEIIIIIEYKYFFKLCDLVWNNNKITKKNTHLKFDSMIEIHVVLH